MKEEHGKAESVSYWVTKLMADEPKGFLEGIWKKKTYV